MIGAVPSALDGGVGVAGLGAVVARDLVVPPPIGAAVPTRAADDEPPVTQPEVDALVEPVPRLDCVPEPVQSVPADRAVDWSIAPDTLGTAVSLVPNIGTSLPTPDDGDAGICAPPPGSVVALGATVLFGFAKADGAVLVAARPLRSEPGVDCRVVPPVERPPMEFCAKAPALPATTKAATASEVKSLLLFMVRASREIFSLHTNDTATSSVPLKT